jgi:hypothetical protein
MSGRWRALGALGFAAVAALVLTRRRAAAPAPAVGPGGVPSPPEVAAVAAAPPASAAPSRGEPLVFGALGFFAVVAFFLTRTVPAYDSYYSLVWGRELMHGHGPDFQVYQAPTHHPLWVAISGVLSVFGGDADRLLVLVCVLSLVALVWATYRTGAAVFEPWAGGVAAVLVLVSPTLLLYTARAYVDIPFVACVMWAAAVEAGTPRGRPRLVMALLLVAGLLRPEAWLLAGVYWLWVGWRRWDLLAMALIAPVVWGIVDAAATGDALYSLHATSGQADQIARVRGLSHVPHELVSALDSTIRAPVVLAGVGGAIAAIVLWVRGHKPRGAVEVPLALVGGGIVTFAATGAAGLSLLPRYLTVPAVGLCLFAGWVAALAVRWLAGAAGRWVAGVVVGGVVAAGLLYAVAGGSMRRAVNELRFIHTSHVRLEAIYHQPSVIFLRACGPVSLPNYRLVPDSRWILHAGAQQVVARSDRVPRYGVALVVTGRKAVSRFGRAAGASAADNRAPSGYRRIAANQTFTAYERCATRTTARRPRSPSSASTAGR